MSNEPAPAPLPIAAATGPTAIAWRLRTREMIFPHRPLVVGIVNVTPDSFSDGGQFFDPQRAIDHALQLVADGADLLDIGGESTRPGSEPVDRDEERRRIEPVVAAICRQVEIPVSIDTSKAYVARLAIDAGAEIINDVTGLQGDADMAGLALATGVGVCVMHMQGTPRTMQDDPQYADVVRDVMDYLQQRRQHLIQLGIEPRRLCLDPGIGFGKSLAHNLTLLASCHQLHALGCPLLVGHSRKRFLRKVLPLPPVDSTEKEDMLAANLAVSLALAAQGVQLIRVHDVRPVRQALALFEAAYPTRPTLPFGTPS